LTIVGIGRIGFYPPDFRRFLENLDKDEVPKTRFLRAKNFQMEDFTLMRRAYFCFLITFGFVLGCGQNNYKTVGFPGDQERFLPASRDYDQRERVDDSTNFNKGNFEPYDPDPDFLYY
jgi:hypothetical protein